MKTFLRVTAALILPVASLTALAAAAPFAAAGAPTPCTDTYTSTAAPAVIPPTTDPQGPLGWTGMGVPVQDDRLVADVDLGVDISMLRGQDLGVLAYKGSSFTPHIQLITPNQVQGSVNGSYTFDDEGANEISGTSPTPGRYRTHTPATVFEGQPASGTWSVWINNHGNGTGTLKSFWVTITYTTCDTEGDGHEEKADNCPSVANVDQANLDGDSLGDLCDRDADGDGVANDIDECPRVLSTLNTGCPSASRSVALTQRRSKLKIAVTSSAPACITTKRVMVYRKRRGKDPKVFTVTTNSVGKARHTAPRKPGRYYAQVTTQHVPGVVDCAADTSRIIKISRR